jgi:hypothetical protein
MRVPGFAHNSIKAREIRIHFPMLPTPDFYLMQTSTSQEAIFQNVLSLHVHVLALLL